MSINNKNLKTVSQTKQKMDKTKQKMDKTIQKPTDKKLDINEQHILKIIDYPGLILIRKNIKNQILFNVKK